MLVSAPKQSLSSNSAQSWRDVNCSISHLFSENSPRSNGVTIDRVWQDYRCFYAHSDSASKGSSMVLKLKLYDLELVKVLRNHSDCRQPFLELHRQPCCRKMMRWHEAR